MDFGKSVILFISILCLAWWAGLVMKAEGEDKLREACHPISWTMVKLGDVTEGLVGFRPNWTEKSRKVLEGGCLYFASVLLSSDELGEGVEGGEAQGGVRTD
jgi:hypothetical protein